jgi:hypothetical protein
MIVKRPVFRRYCPSHTYRPIFALPEALVWHTLKLRKTCERPWKPTVLVILSGSVARLAQW